MSADPFDDLIDNVPIRLGKDFTSEEARAVERAICGAIGWISATTNAGNHGVAKETCERLRRAASYFSDMTERLSTTRE